MKSTNRQEFWEFLKESAWAIAFLLVILGAFAIAQLASYIRQSW